MSPDPPLARAEVVRAASGRAWLIGAAVGGVAGFVAVACTLSGVICCLMQLVTLLVPAGAGTVAGLIAAGAPVYRGLGPGEGLWVGAGLGARAGASSALSSALGPMLVTVGGVGALAATGTLQGSDLLGVGVAFGVWWAIVGGAMLLGVVCGAAAGAVVGEIRQPLVSREPPPER